MESPKESGEILLEPDTIKREGERLLAEFQQTLVELPEFQQDAATAFFEGRSITFKRGDWRYVVTKNDYSGGSSISRYRGEEPEDYLAPPQYTEYVLISLLDKASYRFQSELENVREEGDNSPWGGFKDNQERIREPNAIGYYGPDFFEVDRVGGKDYYVHRKNTPAVLQKINGFLAELKGSNPAS